MSKNITTELLGLPIFKIVGKHGPVDPHNFQTNFSRFTNKSRAKWISHTSKVHLKSVEVCLESAEAHWNLWEPVWNLRRTINH